MFTRDEYLSPDDPGYDRQVLRISRQLTFTQLVPITSYPDMTVSDAIAYEYEQELPVVIESLSFIDEQIPGQSVELRTHVEIQRRAPDESTE